MDRHAGRGPQKAEPHVRHKKVQDIRGRYLLLFSNEWSIRWALEHNEGLELSEFSR